ncbi:superoxide dismutase [Francisella halioticida]|uniref:Superoxide dismutase [Cu-Zn] n=1 Tax=Francisella halioticida TaxID=549298 RepID=A0ABM6M1K4_9GAMM|nr:superoxide dismutase family protein [Francisella halioticida]ASG68643.1 superoxide dismutase [Francisella halioticida]
MAVNISYKIFGIVLILVLILVLLTRFSLFEEEPYDRCHDGELIVHMKSTDTNKEVGTITIAPYIQNGKREGMLITPHLYNLPKSSTHGIHIHVNPSCKNKRKLAGGHWDPQNTGKHLGPYNENGHKGDLPVLVVNSNGTATKPILAHKLDSLEELVGHSIMIHEGPDNYSDKPKPLGGGGNRMWCGVITD